MVYFCSPANQQRHNGGNGAANRTDCSCCCCCCCVKSIKWEAPVSGLAYLDPEQTFDRSIGQRAQWVQFPVTIPTSHPTEIVPPCGPIMCLSESGPPISHIAVGLGWAATKWMIWCRKKVSLVSSRKIEL